jgi:hypothetical protein
MAVAKLTQNITVSGWASGYARFEISEIAVTNGTAVRIGVYGSFPGGNLWDTSTISN